MAASMIFSRLRICHRLLAPICRSDIEKQLRVSASGSLARSCRFLSCTSTLHKRRKTAEERKSDKIIEYSPKSAKKKSDEIIEVWKNITVRELAKALNRDIDHLYETMIFIDNSEDYDSPNKRIDRIDVIQEIVKKCGVRCIFISAPHKETHHKEVQDAVRRPPPAASECVPRPPVVTVMGHVDHGKTTLLDALRHTHVVDSEFGGITQHIGAFEVPISSGEKITFLDTPGHAAFTAMRSRGAHVTDIVILVVAADDGVMEQTVESIRLAREANVPIIVAINKIDKPEADIERTKQMLLSQGLQLEDSGGEVQFVPVSALTGLGLDQLVEAVSTQATLLQLKADPKGPVEGAVIESSVDSHRGKLSTAIIQRGTLRRGAFLVAGTAFAKVRAMFNDRGQPIREAPPATPVEIVGWKDLPSAGEEIIEVESERRAHEVVEHRKRLLEEKKQQEDLEVIQQKVQDHLKEYKAKLEERRRLGRFRMKPGMKTKENIETDTGPKLSVLVKGDVDGSVEAILNVLETYHSPQCTLDLIHYGVGAITENDIKLAEPFSGVIYAFNVPTNPAVVKLAKAKGVQIKHHNIIYKLIDDLKEEISAKLPLKEVDNILGEANVLQEFVITEGKKKVPVAGCRCVKGNLKKSAIFRVVRGEEVIHEGPAASLRHLKAEVDTIKKDVECGIRLEDVTVRIQPGDLIVCLEKQQVPQTTDWDPGF